jgi:hypothetical protein
MAAVAINITPAIQSGGKPTPRVTSALAEDVVTVTITNPSIKSWYAQVIWTGSNGLYHSTSGQVVTNGTQVPAGFPYNIPIGNNTVFYLAAAAAGTYDITVFSY